MLYCECVCVLSADRLQCVLNWVGVSVSDLSPSAVKCLQSVASTAVALGTKDCSDTRYTCIVKYYYMH